MQILDFATFFARSSDVIEDDHELFQALDRLPDVSEKGPWLAGGAIRRTLMKTPLESDFDFFFASQEQFDAFGTSLKSKGAWLVSKNDHNATYKLPSKAPEPKGEDDFTPYQPEIVIQAITTKWYADLSEVLDSFDFTICQFGYDGSHLVCGDYALWDLGRRRLVPHKITYGTASLRRLLKYTKQGFTICGGGLSDFLEKIAADPSVINRETLYLD